MNRTVRNGLAVAGMAGGIFFLGQAVASADGGEVAQDNSNGTSQTAGAESGHDDAAAGNGNGTLQVNAADTSTTIVNKPDQSTGSVTNSVEVVLPSAPAVVKIEDVSINQSGTTGSNHADQTVSDLPDQHVSQSNSNETVQVAEAEGDEGWHPGKPGNNNGPRALNSNGGGGDDAEAGNGNLTGQLNLLDGSTTIINAPDQTTGSVNNSVVIDFSNAAFYCGGTMVLSTEQSTKCEYLIKIEGLEINQSGTTGSNYANQTIGGGDKDYGHPHADHHKPGYEADCPEHAKPAVAPMPHKAAPVAHRAAPMNTYAQPKGELAYTGAETTAPLALGLIALGAGGALTLAGRRRSTTAAV
ncbi:hypothetical protein [Blastococcus litoris]|uniref:hypothetical protein n=1 Tax=Blastococcus litoris TaxID=2171622 RepID=UPI0013DEB3E1|nr:hypothetical protein [Blastococcus litoris]